MGAAMNYAEKKKYYMKVFYGLIALTVVELIIVYLPIPALAIALLVAIFSSAKAVVVGYYYMHLEHETRWMKIVACLPLIAFFYAVFLVVDSRVRTPSVYMYEPARVLPKPIEEQKDPFGLQKAAEEAQAQLESQKLITGDAASAPRVETGTQAAPAAPQDAPASDPAADEWR